MIYLALEERKERRKIPFQIIIVARQILPKWLSMGTSYISTAIPDTGGKGMILEMILLTANI